MSGVVDAFRLGSVALQHISQAAKHQIPCDQFE
jgi:hypothetical protein